ncbi:MAG TPA: polyprenyl synthetase family protein [Chloroflexia bacterium]|nr:polyprenyl synthetase family protein [Chloroflexia bacterium]
MNSVQTLEKADRNATSALTDSSLQAELEKVDEMLQEAANLNFPMLNSLLKAIIAAGGKRLRPQLALLAARLSGKNEQLELQKLYQVAAAVEMLHTASLVHDDTIDEALLRRGAATLNSSLSGGTVILVGDYLFAQSAILITRPGNPQVVKIFAECLATICDGELTQIFATHKWNQSREEYYKRIYCKTAVLFATACELGAIMGDSDEEVVAKLRRFGHLLGMGFQVIDDIIDFYPAEVTGKATGGDLRQGIVTLPTMYFFEKASSEDADFVKGLIERRNASDEEIQRAVDLIRNSGAFDLAFAEARDFIERAKELLVDIPESEARTRLLQIADYALARQK